MVLICSFQRNEVGSSTAMEYEGFQWCMAFILAAGIAMSTYVSDRHTSITKHMQEKFKNVRHYFDLCHLKKSKCTEPVINIDIFYVFYLLES